MQKITVVLCLKDTVYLLVNCLCDLHGFAMIFCYKVIVTCHVALHFCCICVYWCCVSVGTALLWWKFVEDYKKRQLFSQLFNETSNETSSETFNQTFYQTNGTLNETFSRSLNETNVLNIESPYFHLAVVASMFTVSCSLCSSV